MTDRRLTPEGLKIAIGLPSAILLVVGGMVGVGVFVNPAVVARSLPSPALSVLAWVLGGGFAILGALVYGELAARIPATGGEYAYLREAYGPLAGFLFGWTTLLVVQAGGMAAVAIIFAKTVNVLMGGGAPEGALVVAALAALAGVNCLGVVSGNGLQGVLGFLKVAAIAALVIAGLIMAPHHVLGLGDRAHELTPGWSVGVAKAFGAAMIAVVFSYGGWQTAAYVAGEIRDPTRNLAMALLAGVGVVIALYLLVDLACLRALGSSALGRTLTPTSDVLSRATGALGARLASALIALSAIGYLSQSMLTGPRVYFAMARDGLFFRHVAEVATSTRTPVLAIVLQAGWTAILALSGTYEQILSYVVATNLLFFGVSASSLFVFRRRDRRLGLIRAAGFRTPGHPATTLVFILACALVVASSFWAYPINSLIGYGIMALGVPPYVYWSRQARGRSSTRNG